MQKCEYCKKDFLASKIGKKCCSVKCWHKLNYQQNKDKIKSKSKEWYYNNKGLKKKYQIEQYRKNKNNEVDNNGSK